jgi:hypothetical protein
MQRAKIELSFTILSNRLKTCVKQLHLYRKRAHASEAVTASDFKHGLRSQGKLNEILRKSLDEVRVKFYSTMDTLLIERRERSLIDLNASNCIKKMKVYEAKIAELETKGPFMLRAKEEALTALDEKIKATEDTCKKWFRIELPKLISGYPILEENIPSLLDGLKMAANPSSSSSPSKIIPNTIGSVQNDPYALSEALCISKAIQTSLEVKITSLEERNYILKEKVISLQGVLMKWKDQINMQADNHTASSDQQLSNIIYEKSADTLKFQEQIRSLSEIVVALEEENVEVKARCDHAVERSEELKQLLDAIVDEEQVFHRFQEENNTHVKLLTNYIHSLIPKF